MPTFAAAGRFRRGDAEVPAAPARDSELIVAGPVPGSRGAAGRGPKRRQSGYALQGQTLAGHLVMHQDQCRGLPGGIELRPGMFAARSHNNGDPDGGNRGEHGAHGQGVELDQCLLRLPTAHLRSGLIAAFQDIWEPISVLALAGDFDRRP